MAWDATIIIAQYHQLRLNISSSCFWPSRPVNKLPHRFIHHMSSISNSPLFYFRQVCSFTRRRILRQIWAKLFLHPFRMTSFSLLMLHSCHGIISRRFFCVKCLFLIHAAWCRHFFISSSFGMTAAIFWGRAPPFQQIKISLMLVVHIRCHSRCQIAHLLVVRRAYHRLSQIVTSWRHDSNIRWSRLNYRRMIFVNWRAYRMPSYYRVSQMTRHYKAWKQHRWFDIIAHFIEVMHLLSATAYGQDFAVGLQWQNYRLHMSIICSTMVRASPYSCEG